MGYLIPADNQKRNLDFDAIEVMEDEKDFEVNIFAEKKELKEKIKRKFRKFGIFYYLGSNQRRRDDALSRN